METHNGVEQREREAYAVEPELCLHLVQGTLVQRYRDVPSFLIQLFFFIARMDGSFAWHM